MSLRNLRYLFVISYIVVRQVFLDDGNRNTNLFDNKPIVKYDNADIDKVKILKENKGKSGVYL